jgi:dTDP-glucose pyrophosphorylase
MKIIVKCRNQLVQEVGTNEPSTARLIGEEFIAGDACELVLGDNIFYGHGLQGLLAKSAQRTDGATVFGYYVSDPSSCGAAEFNDDGVVIDLEKRPKDPTPLEKTEYGQYLHARADGLDT